MTEANYFNELNALSFKPEQLAQKNGLTYLPWAIAWSEIKKRYPKSYYTVYETPEGCFYFTDGRTCWVKTGVTVVFDDGSALEHIERLPVMNNRNASIKAEEVTSMDANKAIQRSLTKAAARHGVGLYIYAGEDISEDLKTMKAEVAKVAKKKIREGIDRTKIEKTIAEYNNGNPNSNAIMASDVCEQVIAALELLKKEKDGATK